MAEFRDRLLEQTQMKVLTSSYVTEMKDLADVTQCFLWGLDAEAKESPSLRTFAELESHYTRSRSREEQSRAGLEEVQRDVNYAKDQVARLSAQLDLQIRYQSSLPVIIFVIPFLVVSWEILDTQAALALEKKRLAHWEEQLTKMRNDSQGAEAVFKRISNEFKSLQKALKGDSKL